MAKIKTTDRRKRRPSSSKEAPSPWSTAPVILLAGVILTVLISSSSNNEDPTSSQNYYDQQRRQLKLDDPYAAVGQHQQLQQRRTLTVDVGVEENVWRRQLRARKARNQRGAKTSAVTQSRRTAATKTEEAGGVIFDEAGQPTRRMAVIPRYEDRHHFEDCVGTSVAECETLINAFVKANSAQFNGLEELSIDIRKIRELTDPSYYKVVIRTDITGLKAFGVFDDGMIEYPWPWIPGVGYEEKDPKIGSWNCMPEDDNGDITYMTPQECCTMIQSDIDYPNESGHFLACFVEEPVGGPHNAQNEGRAIVVVDGSGQVVRPPINH